MNSPQESFVRRPVQRISKTRRDYNRWVADETVEDYALRFAPRSFRKWSAARVASTAFGAVSFLALEAIGASITLSYGFANAAWAIATVSVVIFLTGLPIAAHAARNGLDMDLLARGAGFGYLGSTITSLIYAGFTFIFLALEAAIMAQALELWLDVPKPVGYLVSAIVVIPLVTYGVTFLSRLQLWTQPAWLVLLVLPFVAVAIAEPQALRDFTSLNGRLEGGDTFSWASFGAACTVAAALIAQIGEQVDFLRFMPEAERCGRWRWWAAVLLAGPGWILLGGLKMIGGAFLAFLAIQHEVPVERAIEPTQMYLVAYQTLVGPGTPAIVLTCVFVLISQIKINVTNAYAGSLAWSNFFARLTHTHPGRVVWLVFNVIIAVLLMMMGLFEALERVLAVYALLAVAWVGAIVGDLVISKPLGISPARIEFRRAYLFDINPAGVGAMLAGAGLSCLAYLGVLGATVQPASTLIALVVSCLLSPMIGWLTGGAFYIARTPVAIAPPGQSLRCTVCDNRFEVDDMAQCPAYDGVICSLCCTLDSRCEDRCKTHGQAHVQIADLLTHTLRVPTTSAVVRRYGLHAVVSLGILLTLGTMLWLLYSQETLRLIGHPDLTIDLQSLFLKIFAGSALIAAVVAWWFVLTGESRLVAQAESERQNQLLLSEIDAHRITDIKLQAAKESAESANHAKTRFLTGISHEMRSPLNSIIGYSDLLLAEPLPPPTRQAIETIHRSGDHLSGLVDGLLELSRIEAGKIRVEYQPLRLAELLDQVMQMFEPSADAKGLAFQLQIDRDLPRIVRADAKRLRQVLINLIGNAIKFTDRGKVLVTASHAHDLLTVSVSDTGPGIAEADQTRIFAPFERVDVNRDGIGIGLTITQLLVDLMGGDVTLSSLPGKGSEFRVRVYAPAPINDLEPAAAFTLTGYDGPRIDILIVDDTIEHRRVLTGMLGPLDFRLSEAGSLKEARAQLRIDVPGLILLDLNLPDGNGMTLCREMREAGLKVPVIITSADAHRDRDPVADNALVTAFIAKPIRRADLYDQIGAALGLRWQRDETLAWPRDNAQAAAPGDPALLRELLALSSQGRMAALNATLVDHADQNPAHAEWAESMVDLARHDATAFRESVMQALRDEC